MSEEKIYKNRCTLTNVRKFISKYPDFQYDGCCVKCLVCNLDLRLWKQSQCEKHLRSANHKWKKSGRKPYDEFIMDLIFMMSDCNIPFNNIKKEPFRKFWDKYNPNWKLPSESTMRNYLPRVRERMENTIRQELHDQKLWLTVDASSDSKKNALIHIIVQVLKPNESSPPYLLASKRLQSCTDETITNVVLTTLEEFEISINQVLILVTDSGSAMLRVGRLLKLTLPNLLHITCILNALNLLAETIRHHYPNVSELIAQTKAVFVNSPKRIRQFHERCPNIPEPPEPVSTRWGTWLEAAFYYFQHFQPLQSLITQACAIEFEDKKETSIKASQLIFQDHQVKIDLETIFNNYQVITNAIIALEKSSLSLVESLQIIDNVQKVLENLSDEKSVWVKEKFNNILQKNTDLTRLKEIYNNIVPIDTFSCFKDHYHFANLTSVHVEQSFSLYKDIFSPLRVNLKDTTAETYTMLQMFGRTHSKF